MGRVLKKTGHLASRLHFLGTVGSVVEKGDSPVKNGTSGHPSVNRCRYKRVRLYI
jgi:hypothetical protein